MWLLLGSSLPKYWLLSAGCCLLLSAVCCLLSAVCWLLAAVAAAAAAAWQSAANPDRLPRVPFPILSTGTLPSSSVRRISESQCR